MSFFKMPDFYRSPLGLPLHWRDEMTGILPDAVWSYIKYRAPKKDENVPAPEGARLEILLDYLRYFIDAPCWRNNCLPDGEIAKEVEARRKEIREIKTVQEIGPWISRCLDLGIDPL